MAFESPLLNWVVWGSLLIGLPLLLFLSAYLSRFLRPGSGALTLAIFTGTLLLIVIGGCALLDHSGVTVIGEVLQKNEMLVYHSDGSWNREAVAEVRYRPTESSPPQSDTLSLIQSRFDETFQGDFAPLSYVNVPGTLHLLRLENQSVSSQLWVSLSQQPFFLLLGFGLYLLLAAKLILRLSLPAMIFASGLALIGAWWISGVAVPLWQQSAIRLGSMNTVGADVREIHQPYLGKDARAWLSEKLFASYDVILVDFIPLGHTQRLMAVDIVDRGSSSLKAGDQISVQYSPASPRLAVIADATRNHMWENAAIASVLAALALATVAVAAFFVREGGEDLDEPPQPRRRRRRRTQIRPA